MEEKLIYENPEMEVMIFSCKDIVVTSFTGDDIGDISGSTGYGEGGW